MIGAIISDKIFKAAQQKKICRTNCSDKPIAMRILF